MKLYNHQRDFVTTNPRKAILAWSMRVGKSYAIIGWLKNRPNVSFLLVCPKRIKEQWKKHLTETDTSNADILTKEEIKKKDISNYGGLVVDEVHHAASGLFSPHKTSEVTRTLYEWVRAHPDAPVLLATATPICSMPANLHTLAALTGTYWDPKKFRLRFYELITRPYAPRPFWSPKKNWRKEIAPLAQKVCYVKRLSDITEPPAEYHIPVSVSLSAKTKTTVKEYADENPAAEWYGKHKLAQGMEKLAKIRELAADEPKVIVVAKYLDQIAQYEQELSKDREVVVLSGQTKDQPAAITRAQEMTEGYFLIQADCGEGFSGDDFSILIFASESWRYVSHEQMLGRIRHLQKKRANYYYYLLADEKDRKIRQRIEAGKDFSLAGITKETTNT